MWAGNYAGDGTFAVGAKVFTQDAIQRLGILDFIELYKAHLMNPLLICGMFIGAMSAFVFCAMTMKAVGRAAGAMVNEVRRQFKESPGIMDGTQKADYARCVNNFNNGRAERNDHAVIACDYDPGCDRPYFLVLPVLLGCWQVA